MTGKPISFRRGLPPITIAEPDSVVISFREIADRLARQIRFNGEIGAISVAQHSVMGAEALFAETRDPFHGALFVLHDAHEFVLGDMARPVTDQIEAECPGFRVAWSYLKLKWDRRIYKSAGLPSPDLWTVADTTAIDLMDQRMMAAEVLAIYGPRAAAIYPARIRKTPLLQESLTPWPAERAAERFLKCLARMTGKVFR